MAGLSSFLRSTVGLKLLAAATGLPLVGWIVLHALGNLTLFGGATAADGYAASLRALGPLLWAVRAGVFLCAVIHVAAVAALARRARAARPVAYAQLRPRAVTVAGRAMRVGGVVLLAFLVFHLLHLTFGTIHPDFQSGKVHANTVMGLRSWPVAGLYLLAAVALGLHLGHGLTSAWRSLGVGDRVPLARRPLVGVIAAAVALAFASVPLAVVTGVLR